MIRAGRVFAWVFAIGLFVGGLWYGLILQNVTVSDEPSFGPGTPRNQVLRAFYDWFLTTLTQERLDGLIAIVGFVALIGVSLTLRVVFGRERPLSLIASSAITLGSVLWITGNLLQLGGHRAVEIMARVNTDLVPANAIHFTVDQIDNAFELSAFALIGGGVIAFAVDANRTAILPKGWGWFTLLLGALLLLAAVAYAFDNGDLVDVLLLIGGVVLAPIWGIWLAVLFGRAPLNAGQRI
jgi:hypothetical protein